MIDSREDSAGSSQRAVPHNAMSNPKGRMGAAKNRNSRVIWKPPGTSDPDRASPSTRALHHWFHR